MDKIHINIPARNIGRSAAANAWLDQFATRERVMNDAAKVRAKSGLPEEIRLRREAHKLSQIALADACGVTPQAINRIENGHSPSVKTLEKIATVLGPFEIPCVHDWRTDGTPEQTCAVYVMIDDEISRAIWLEDQNVYVLCTGMVSSVDAWREQ